MPLNILLVEDDDGDALALERAVSKLQISCSITRVYDGKDALNLLHSSDRRGLESPFVVLVDVNMPRMNGHEFLREVRENPYLQHLTVFMLSTSADEADITAAYSRNVAGYAVKGTTADAFAQLAATLDGYRKTFEMK